MVMSPVELGTKSHCAGEGQQQFTRLANADITPRSWGRKVWLWVPRDAEPRIAVPTRASSNLPDRLKQTVGSESYCGFSQGTTREFDWNISMNLQKNLKCRGLDSNLVSAEYKSAQICLNCSLCSVDSWNEIVLLNLKSDWRSNRDHIEN
jgi:hypothetical protein